MYKSKNSKSTVEKNWTTNKEVENVSQLRTTNASLVQITPYLSKVQSSSNMGSLQVDNQVNVTSRHLKTPEPRFTGLKGYPIKCLVTLGSRFIAWLQETRLSIKISPMRRMEISA